MEIKQKDILTFVKKSIQRGFFHYGRTKKYVTIENGNAENEILQLLRSTEPVMIARIGSTELQCLAAYLKEIHFFEKSHIYNKIHWDDVLYNMHYLAGFFPKNNKEEVLKFCKLMLDDISELDILGSWRKEEYYIKNRLKGVKRINLNVLEPYFNKTPWTKELKGKRVLVIHPFNKTIENQYRKRQFLYDNPDILPEFDLITLKAVQTISGNSDPRFSNWFEALDFMKDQIDNTDFDVAILGCGAYGFPLAAHIKRKGKKAVHLGGALQLLFGIKGKRWENRDKFRALMNEYWVYPSDEDKPKKFEMVEGGCYW